MFTDLTAFIVFTVHNVNPTVLTEFSRRTSLKGFLPFGKVGIFVMVDKFGWAHFIYNVDRFDRFTRHNGFDIVDEAR